jgi:thymidine kinase
MFIEPKYSRTSKKGWIEVICGSMFSGKTEELIRRMNRAKIAGLSTEIFKPTTDTRYHESEVVSHNSNTIPSTPVDSSLNILLLYKIVYVCETLAAKGVRVIVAGLDMDYMGKPFGPMPNLMAVAEYVTKVHAICVCCGDIATHSFRKSNDRSLIKLGEKDTYEARCRDCFQKGLAKNPY